MSVSSLERNHMDILGIRLEIRMNLGDHNSIQQNIEYEPNQHWANPVKRPFISLLATAMLPQVTYAASAGFRDILTEFVR